MSAWSWAKLAIVCAALPLLWLIAKGRLQARFAAAVSVLLGLFGVSWFLERAFHLGFMPI